MPNTRTLQTAPELPDTQAQALKKSRSKAKPAKKVSGKATKPASSIPASSTKDSRKATGKPAGGANRGGRREPKFTKPVHPKAKVTFRRNVLPPLLGLLTFAGLLGLLNAQWIIAQYEYRTAQPASARSFSEQPATTNPDAPAKIYIPKINLEAPLVTGVRSFEEATVQQALQRGVVQYGASADPGQKGNLVVIGHSSGQLWAPGDYKFVFTMLDKLAKDDRILVDYKGKRYIYRVTSEKVVPPTDLSVLQHGDEPELTLITCTPVGTSKDRLIITARQVSPNPADATALTAEQTRPIITTVIPN